MKTSNVTLVTSKIKAKLRLNLFIKRTSSEVFNMGSSSFLINYVKNSLANPILTFQCERYSTGDYQPIELAIVLVNRCIGIQLRCDGIGKSITNKFTYGERIVTVEMDIVNSSYNLQWRAIDTEVVTPDKFKVDTIYTIK
jgi:hypothetical protein